LAERYRLIRPLARGGMGSVWKAEHLALNSEVALKIIDPRIARLDMGVPRFLREARALALLRSPHIVQVSDFGSDGDLVYLVMELLEGRTLGQRLKADGKLSAPETNRILGDVCKAMRHAHERGIVHRDLKPDNIFLCDQSREHVTKVVDFGIAKPMASDASSNTGTEVGTFLGTPSYMSPEQCRGAREIDQRSDLWAIGAITYECLVGKRLFEGDVIGDLAVRICTEALPIAAHSSQLPPGFDVWLQKAMAKAPADRFQSAIEFARELAVVLDGVSAPRGVDSADTLSDEPVSGRAPGVAEGSSSTFEKGSLTKSTGQLKAKKRVPFGLAAGGVGILAVVVLVALTRNDAFDGVSKAEAGGIAPAPEIGLPPTGAASLRTSGPSNEPPLAAGGSQPPRGSAALDAGGVPVEARPPPAKPPVLGVEQSARARRPTPAANPKANAKQGETSETELMRRKR
jgi:serine/threonine protein kinase